MSIAHADEKPGVLIPGMGEVTSTFIAGVEAVERGPGERIDALTQLGTVRLGKRTENRVPRIKNFVPLAPLQCLSFGTWDIFEDIPYETAVRTNVLDRPVLEELEEPLSAICGKEFKTGQTYMKTLLAPGFNARMLGLHGWFSTNIRGNRDGEVLEDPGSFKSKEENKLSVLEQILQPELYSSLYEDLYHGVPINDCPPRGDSKEGCDNIDILGWLGYPMQIKIDFLCQDSVLAAPLVLDLVLFMDLALRAGMKGTQEWQSFYFKGPMTAPGLYPEHDIFIQLNEARKYASLDAR